MIDEAECAKLATVCTLDDYQRIAGKPPGIETTKEMREFIGTKDRHALVLELGDSLWYLSAFAAELGVTLSHVAVTHLLKLRDQKKAREQPMNTGSLATLAADKVAPVEHSANYPRGYPLQTVSGTKFYPADPRPEEVHIGDIAAALSKLCRYGGQCLRFYSVAEHCIHVAHAAPPELKLVGLLHDASEAYLVDMPRPVKRMLPAYERLEARLERAIAKKFALPYPWSEEIKRLDNAILTDEWVQNMSCGKEGLWGPTEPALGIELQFWEPIAAEQYFLEAFVRWR